MAILLALVLSILGKHVRLVFIFIILFGLGPQFLLVPVHLCTAFLVPKQLALHTIQHLLGEVVEAVLRVADVAVVLVGG